MPSESPTSSTRESARVATLATAALGTVVIVLALAMGGPAYFLQLGPDKPAYPHAVDVLGADVQTPVADGHDGVFFWELARDPLLTNADDLNAYLDRPLYRAQRIGYPALAAPWRLLGEGGLLWGLVVVNLTAVWIGTFAVASWAAGRGRSASVGYLFAANPLTWLGLLFDFGGVVAMAGTVVALAAFERRRWLLVVAGGVAGALAREAMLGGLGAAAALAPGYTWRERARLILPAAIVVAAWRVYAMGRLAAGADAEIVEFEVIPFAGMWDAWHRVWTTDGAWVQAIVGVALTGTALATVWFFARAPRTLELAAAFPSAVLTPFLSVFVVSLWHNLVRAVGPALILLMFHFLTTPNTIWSRATTE